MKSGIYQIKNLVNNKRYIGSAVILSRRHSQHILHLTLGDHKNAHLQSAWNKYGAASFDFQVLEYCEEADLITLEQIWIDKFDFNMLYNLCPTAGSQLGKRQVRFCQCGSPVKTQYKKDGTFAGYCRTCGSKECIYLVRNTKWIGKKHTDLSIEKQSISHSKEYDFTNPYGATIHVHNLKKFCLFNDLCVTSMRNLSIGKIEEYKGWRN